MATKLVEVADIGTVKLYKRRDSRSIRLSISSTGEVRVSMPNWVSYDAGIKFALSKRNWILKQLQNKTTVQLSDGQAVGKSHHLYLVPTSQIEKVSTRVDGTNIRVSYPLFLSPQDPAVQKAAEKASIRAMRSQADALLPQRLHTLSLTHELPYRSARVKQLKGRWGSCDSEQNIVLNLFLMKLPWQLIDYVLVHELTHTRVLHHGADFWEEFERHLPNARELRREIRQFQPVVAP